MTHEMVKGTTEPQDLAIFDDGEAFVGTGLTIAIEWIETTPAGTISVAWLSQAGGTVRVTGTGDMLPGSYPFRFTVTDSGGKVGYAPNGKEPDLWLVTP